jgi:Tfp pilus assembly protein PilV
MKARVSDLRRGFRRALSTLRAGGSVGRAPGACCAAPLATIVRPAGEEGCGRFTDRRVESSRRGGMLLEVIVSLAIFVVAGGAILNLVTQTMTGLERSREQARAADLARSAMAKIEAGIETAQTLNGPVERSAEGAAAVGGVGGEGWELEIDTEPSQFRGLTRVSVNAVKRVGEAARVEAEYLLVQLVRLGGKGEDRAGEEDSIAEKARQGLERQPGSGSGAPAGGRP